MLVLVAQNFIGANTEIQPKRLADGYGVECRNLRWGAVDLRPYNAPQLVYTLPAGTQRTSLYRLGRATASDTQYWLAWVNDVDVVRSLLADDPTERIYYTGDGEPRTTDTTLALAGEPYPTAYRKLGIPAPATQMGAALAVAGTGEDETRSYLDTFVSDRGEESAPMSNPRAIVVKGGSTVNLSSLAAVPTGSHGITLRRIYVSTGNDYQLTVEQAAASTTAVDNNVRSTVLPSGGATSRPAWLVPPTNLKGLIELWNGMIGGFVGKSLRVCEANRPWAWPIEYENLVTDPIVGTGKYLQNWVVLTTGNPRLFVGSSPLSMSEVPTGFGQACVSKRSIVSLDRGVCWAGKRGLCYIGAGGERVVTRGIISETQWAAMNPATMHGQKFDEETYIGFYTDSADGLRKSFLIRPEAPQGFISLDAGAFGSYYDPIADRLFLLDSTNTIKKWDSGAALDVTFRTGIKRMPMECNPGAAQVEATVYPVTFKLWGDGVLRYTKTVTDAEPFRLPGGYLAQEYQAEVKGAGPIQLVVVGGDVSDLAQKANG